MNAVIQLTAEAEEAALPILLRHSPGTVLANRTYVVDAAVLALLREAGVAFREVTPHLNLPLIEDVSIGERI